MAVPNDERHTLTTSNTTDTVDLGDVVAGLFKLAGVTLTDSTEEATTEPDTEGTTDVPYTEAVRILKDLEERAVDQGDTDLALSVADRWIQLGDRGI